MYQLREEERQQFCFDGPYNLVTRKHVAVFLPFASTRLRKRMKHLTVTIFEILEAVRCRLELYDSVSSC
jgi:hypothetical protein